MYCSHESHLGLLFSTMSTKSGSIDYWRKFFGWANSSDIFEVIENAIMVAASDYPKEFKLRMNRIAETLFSCGLTKVERDDGDLNGGGGDFEGGISKVICSTNDHTEINLNRVSNYSYQEAEALTKEIEEETQIVGEVLRIKEIQTKMQDQNSKHTNEISFEKLERTKRKLREGYQKAENAKKQRTIQVIELHDIHKQELGQRNFHLKPMIHNRYWKGRH